MTLSRDSDYCLGDDARRVQRANTVFLAISRRCSLDKTCHRARAALLAPRRRSSGVIVHNLAFPPFRPRSAGSSSFFLVMPEVYICLARIDNLFASHV